MWRVLSKLNYSFFLVYPIVLFLLYANTYQGFYLRLSSIVFALLHHIVVGYLVGFTIYIFIESPLNNFKIAVQERLKHYLSKKSTMG